MAEADSLQGEINDLLEGAREEGKRYSSAAYRGPDGAAGQTGLAIRLEAIEAALLKLAAAVDADSAEEEQ